ncbi:putative gustatory receptor 28b [Nilaparvata lugens]|uniref:putative gustatory receptor 28b n=1 Tax=Nilaparvata lugens TaxID=108931 RepID=UPI00193DF33E|nr:putative gustatory receptor 28b [Nilaparvata lugens]
MVVHRLLKYGDISNIANELRHFSLELLHEKFRFSVYGLFDIDYTLITTVTGVVCTYLIILYQLMGSKSNSTESPNTSIVEGLN